MLNLVCETVQHQSIKKTTATLFLILMHLWPKQSLFFKGAEWDHRMFGIFGLLDKSGSWISFSFMRNVWQDDGVISQPKVQGKQ